MDIKKPQLVKVEAFVFFLSSSATPCGLDKLEVIELMVKYLSQCDIPIEIYEYDPLAPDDIFEKFKNKWFSIPYADLKATTHIRQKKQIETINQALHLDNLKSMISLISYPGIGLKTMECCFKIVMNYDNSASLFSDNFEI